MRSEASLQGLLLASCLAGLGACQLTRSDVVTRPGDRRWDASAAGDRPSDHRPEPDAYDAIDRPTDAWRDLADGARKDAPADRPMNVGEDWDAPPEQDVPAAMDAPPPLRPCQGPDDFCDDFEVSRPDEWELSGTAWTWSTRSLDDGSVHGVLVPPQGHANRALVRGRTWRDVTVEARLGLSFVDPSYAYFVGVLAQYQDPSRRYAARLHGDGHLTVETSSRTVSSGRSLDIGPADAWHVLAMRVSTAGDKMTITVFWDGAPELTLEDDAAASVAGQIGLESYGNVQVAFDELRAGSASSADGGR